MTIETVSPVIEYVKNGATTAFAVPFQFRSSSELIVSSIDQSSGVETTLVVGVDYSVTGGGGAAGTVTLTLAGTSGDTLRIQRSTSRAQISEYETGASFPAKTVEANLDQLAMIAQEHDRDILAEIAARVADILRTARVPEGETLGDMPSAAARANKYLKFDNGGEPTVGDAMGAKGEPGGNVMAVGLFTDVPNLSVPVGTDLIVTSGQSAVGIGPAQFAANGAVDAAYVTANPRTAVRDSAGRGFLRGGGVILASDATGALLGRDMRIAGGTFDASAVASYSSSVLQLDGADRPSIANPVHIDGAQVLGPRDHTGTGIHLKATATVGDKVTFSRITRTYADGFETGIKLEAGSVNTIYVNSNQIEAHTYDCKYHFDLGSASTLPNVMGNFVRSMVQPSAGRNNHRAIRDRGEANIHWNFTWDWGEPRAVIPYDGEASTFQLYETITGATSGASGRLVALTDSGTTGSITLQEVTGTFVDNEDLMSGATKRAVANIPGGYSYTGVAEGAGNKAIEFWSNDAFRGGRHFLLTNLNPWQVFDRVGATDSRSIKIFYGSAYGGFSHICSAPMTSSFADPVGNQDDFLVGADKRFAIYYRQSADRVNWSADAGPASPSLMFRMGMGSSSRALFTAPSGYKRILIDMLSSRSLLGAWMAFYATLFPELVTLRYSNAATSDPDVASASLVDMFVDVPGSKFTQPCLRRNFLSGSARWLCFEFYNSTGINIGVERLSAWVNDGGDRGRAFLASYGDEVYGALDFKSATAADRAIKMNGTKVLGDQGAAVVDAAPATATSPSGGATVDAEARAQVTALIADNAALRTTINALLARLRAGTGHGLIG